MTQSKSCIIWTNTLACILLSLLKDGSLRTTFHSWSKFIIKLISIWLPEVKLKVGRGQLSAGQSTNLPQQLVMSWILQVVSGQTMHGPVTVGDKCGSTSQCFGSLHCTNYSFIAVG